MTVPLRTVRDRLTAFARNLALHLGLLKGHVDYARSVILGRSRSGSNLLRGLLNAHPQVAALGELFQGERKLDWGTPRLPTGARTVDAWRHDPVRFLETAVFGPAPACVRAVGFKIFYYHARSGAWQPVWDYLVRDRAIHVIHIKRANVLRTYLSRQLAAVTNRWVDASGDGRAAGPITLSFEGCLEEFTRTRAWEQQHDRLFRDHPTLDILYERLAADHGAEMRRVQAFLSLAGAAHDPPAGEAAPRGGDRQLRRAQGEVRRLALGRLLRGMSASCRSRRPGPFAPASGATGTRAGAGAREARGSRRAPAARACAPQPRGGPAA